MSLDTWSTRSVDQEITVEILKRHCRIFGYVKLVERVEELEADGEKFQVFFPKWQFELHQQFEQLYGREVGQEVFEKAMRWAIEELFGHHSAMTFE